MDYEKEYKKLKAGISNAYLYAQTDSTKAVLENILPELKESGDERIRKILVHIVKGACDKYGIKYKEDEVTEEKLLAYLEKQKQEWSEGDEKMLTGIIERGSSQVPPYEPALREEQMEWLMNRLKSLRPQPSWKPSEEQMKAIKHAYNSFPNDCSTKSNLKLLYSDLKKLM